MLGRYAPSYRAARSLASSVAARLYECLRRERDVGVMLAVVYACGRIDAPEWLTACPPRTVFVMNPNYAAEIQARCVSLGVSADLVAP